MANRAVSLIVWALALLIAALTLGSAAMVAARATVWAFNPADWAALRFTVVQAALSALISGILAIPVARALFRRRFWSRTVLIRVMAAPFILPVVVAVLGLLAVLGRNGPVNAVLAALNLPQLSIYGFHGVVLAHVFLNLPLAVRMLLVGWQGIPAERFRLAVALDLPPSTQFRHLEAPMLRSVLPGVFAVVFLLCLTSFAVALTLGGGPKASTLELAIYQSLRFDFDLGRAALLAAVQFGLCAVVTLIIAGSTLPAAFGAGLDGRHRIPAPFGIRRALDVLAIGLAIALIFPPLLAVILQGAPGLVALPDGVWRAAARSVLVAAGSTLLGCTIAVTLALAVAKRKNSLLEFAAMLPLAASSLVMGTGLFLLVQPYFLAERLALPITMMVNATMVVPFVFRLLLPEARALHTDYDRLCLSLGLPALTRLRLVTLPRLARPLGFGAGLAAALSMGDLGVIALFAGERSVTLPLMVQQLMGAYKMQAAAGAALLLVGISFALFWSLDRIGGRIADA